MGFTIITFSLWLVEQLQRRWKVWETMRWECRCLRSASGCWRALSKRERRSRKSFYCYSGIWLVSHWQCEEQWLFLSTESPACLVVHVGHFSPCAPLTCLVMETSAWCSISRGSSSADTAHMWIKGNYRRVARKEKKLPSVKIEGGGIWCDFSAVESKTFIAQDSWPFKQISNTLL